jgi:hypothetical protein
MDIKDRPNHRIYIQVLREMSPEKRLLKAFELSEFANQLFIHGLHKRFPDLSGEEFKKILLERLDKCHNRNY